MKYVILIKEMLENNACDSGAWLSSIHKQTAILATDKHQLGFTGAFSTNSLSEISNIQVDCYNSQIFGNYIALIFCLDNKNLIFLLYQQVTKGDICVDVF